MRKELTSGTGSKIKNDSRCFQCKAKHTCFIFPTQRLYNSCDEEYTDKASGACKRRKTVNITSADEFCSDKETLDNVATDTTSS
jgi:hypothetical protein